MLNVCHSKHVFQNSCTYLKAEITFSSPKFILAVLKYFLVQDIKDDMNKWREALYTNGVTYTIKMSYIFNTKSIIIPVSFFKKLDILTPKLKWKNKHP